MKRLIEQLVYSGLIHLHVLREEDRQDGSSSGRTGTTVLAQGGVQVGWFQLREQDRQNSSSSGRSTGRVVLAQGVGQVGRFQLREEGRLQDVSSSRRRTGMPVLAQVEGQVGRLYFRKKGRQDGSNSRRRTGKTILSQEGRQVERFQLKEGVGRMVIVKGGGRSVRTVKLFQLISYESKQDGSISGRMAGRTVLLQGRCTSRTVLS